MRKAYLLIYDNDVGTREEVKATLNSMERVDTWRHDMPNCFYVISESSAQQLYDEFISHNGDKGRFIFIEASTNRQGRLVLETWYLLRHKQLKPKEGK